MFVIWKNSNSRIPQNMLIQTHLHSKANSRHIPTLTCGSANTVIQECMQHSWHMRHFRKLIPVYFKI